MDNQYLPYDEAKPNRVFNPMIFSWLDCINNTAINLVEYTMKTDAYICIKMSVFQLQKNCCQLNFFLWA